MSRFDIVDLVFFFYNKFKLILHMVSVFLVSDMSLWKTGCGIWTALGNYCTVYEPDVLKDDTWSTRVMFSFGGGQNQLSKDRFQNVLKFQLVRGEGLW